MTARAYISQETGNMMPPPHVPIARIYISPAVKRNGSNTTQGDKILANIVEVLRRLELQKIPRTWVARIWDSQFTDNYSIDEFEELDEDLINDDFVYSKFLREIDVGKLYNQVTEMTAKWLDVSSKEATMARSVEEIESGSLGNANQTLTQQVDTAFWTSLIDEEIEFKSLIALLFHHMDIGQKIRGGGDGGYVGADRDLGLKATGLYFILLSIPGSSAFNIFHPMLYSKSLSTFKLAVKLHEVRHASKKRKRIGVRSTQGSQAGSIQGGMSVSSSPVGKPRKRHGSRAGSVTSGISSQTDFWDDSGDEDDDTLNPIEIANLTAGLNKVLYNLLTTLDHFSMKRSEESLEMTVQQLVDLTHLETTYANLDFGINRRRSDLSALAYNAYIGLEKICGPLHGVVDKVQGPLLFRCILPGVLMTGIHGSSDVSPKGHGVIREHALHFIKHLMAHIGDPCYHAVEILVHHLAVKVPDKAEFRQKASSAIVELTLGLPQEYFSRLVRWFFRLAHNDKTAHRQFAIEVMGRLLAENERQNPVTLRKSLDSSCPSQKDRNEKHAMDTAGVSGDASGQDQFLNVISTSEGKEHLDNEMDSGDKIKETTQQKGDTHGTSKDGNQQDTDKIPLANSKDNLFSHKFLFGVIFSRCRDVSATVRAKALHTLADITAANNATVALVIRNLFADLQREDEETPNTFMANHEHVDFVEILQDPDADLSEINPLPSTHAFIDFLRRRALDDSVYVRKNALQVLENILKFSSIVEGNDNIENTEDVSNTKAGKKCDLLNSRYGHELIGILAEHCRDPSLMVRKQMIGSLTELIKTYPENLVVIDNWVEGVFPLILDVEQKAAEKVQESIWQFLFGNLVSYSDTKSSHHTLPWRIMAATEQLKMTKYLRRACSIWASSGQLQPSILDVLKTHVTESVENSNYAWLLLALVSGHVPLKDPQFVMEYFQTSIHTPEGVGLYTLLQILRVLFASVSYLTAQQRRSLHKDLVMLVKKFSIPPELISTSVDICTVVSSLDATTTKGSGSMHTASPSKKISIILSPPSTTQKMGQELNVRLYHKLLDGWAVEIIELIDKELSEKILRKSSTGDVSAAETTRMMRQIFTLGELAQICPHRINKKMFLLMQSIIFQQVSAKLKKSKKKLNEIEDTIRDNKMIEKLSPGNAKASFKPTAKMQALSVLTLAKMCLQNEEMAKKIIPAFGLLLGTTTDVAIKNNIMYALTDMCVRYASLVDPLLPQMTACLKEKSLVVRRTTLTTIINLLQEDYLKLTGNLFFRILQTLSDDSEEILNLTTFYIQQRLLKRKPKVMYSHFIEAIFHFNEYKDHQSYNKFIVSDNERELFSLVGPQNKYARMKLYKFMLENMTDEQRFQTTFKLCKDILQGAVEGSVKLTGKESYELLQDTLSCLASDEIKLASLKTRQDEVGEIDGFPDVEGAVVSAVKKAIISQHVKTNVIENIVPIVIALKRKLEEMKSPLIDDLMSYLREIMKDYKSEVKEILSADKQLAAEIQFDLKKWEEEQAEQIIINRRQEEQRVESRPPSPQLAQQRMLREVLLKAVENLRRNQRRHPDEEDVQEQEELQIQVRPQVMDPGTKAGEADKDPKDNFEDITTTPKRKSLETNFQHQDASEKELEEKDISSSKTGSNKSPTTKPDLQTFIATNLSNNTRRTSAQKQSLSGNLTTSKKSPLNRKDSTENNDGSANVRHARKASVQLEIENDVDECQVALSPKVVLNRLKYSSDVSDSIPADKNSRGSKRKLDEDFPKSPEVEKDQPAIAAPKETSSQSEIVEKSFEENENEEPVEVGVSELNSNQDILVAASPSPGNNVEDRDFFKIEPHSPSAQSSTSLTSTTFEMRIDLVDENTDDENTLGQSPTLVASGMEGAPSETSQENTLREEPISPVKIRPHEPQLKPDARRDATGITSEDITEINVESAREENEKSKSVKKGNTTRKRKHSATTAPVEEVEEEDTLCATSNDPLRPTEQENIATETRPLPKFRLKGAKSAAQRASTLRAISTPTRNETLLRDNVTFNISGVANTTDNLYLANLSAIPMLSPPSPERIQSRRTSKKKSDAQGEEVAMESFRFRHGRKDQFEEMVRRGSKKHESALRTQEEGKSIKKSDNISKHVDLQSQCQESIDEVEEVPMIEEDDRSQKVLSKTRRKRQVVSKHDTQPEKRISKRNKPISESGVGSTKDNIVAESSDVPDEIIITTPSTKSPFKAIRGEGNSFHGWCT